jgi:hypothetical protein
MELWFTQQQVDPDTTGTLIRWYRERYNTYTQLTPLQNGYGADGNEDSDAWYANQDIPSELVKMFGVEIINRGYMQYRLVNIALKPRVNP